MSIMIPVGWTICLLLCLWTSHKANRMEEEKDKVIELLEGQLNLSEQLARELQGQLELIQREEAGITDKIKELEGLLNPLPVEDRDMVSHDDPGV